MIFLLNLFIVALLHKLPLIQLANFEPPFVSIIPYEWEEDDFQNSTLTIISNRYPEFDLRCNASYPIEWITYYDQKDEYPSGYKRQDNTGTYRYADDFEDPNTYTYYATLSIAYSEVFPIHTNFSCKSISNPELQTHLITRTTGQGTDSVINFKMTSDKKYNRKPTPKYFATTCDETSPFSGLETKALCWKCQRGSDHSKVNLGILSCNSAIECNSVYQFYQRQKQGKECYNIIPDKNKTDAKMTEYCLVERKNYISSMILCRDEVPVVFKSHYFGLHSLEEETPKIYSDWSEIDPQEMIKIHPIEEEYVYKGRNVTVTCEMSKYYFSKGSWFGVQAGENINYLQIEDEEPEESAWRGTFQSYLTLHLEINQTIYCFAPVWNSTKWINTSLALNVKIGEPPEILVIKMDKDAPVLYGEENRYIECHFIGQPFPNIVWESPNGSNYEVETDDERFTSKLIFSEVTATTSGDYTCIVESFFGVDNKSFFVRTATYESMDSKPSLLIGSLLLLTTVLFGLVIVVRLWRIIKSQREALRLLTEAEIQEFIDGNPDYISRNEHFNNLTIDALPYNDNFEIARENLEIDYSKLLGSGAFGKVYKGHIKQKDIYYYYYQNITSVEQNGLEVAIKTCDPNVDVVYFKALLSEIKVMAHLGQNENIVSLVGACTHNIRNREVFIAVEFCSKGGLDAYLKNSRNTFVNKVQYGVLIGECKNISENIQGQSQTEPNCGQVSTTNLIKWTLDISNGMEYLQGRRVIHGDLATRNVLLNNDNVAKIGDFGLARQLVECSNYVKKTRCPLPWRHLSPESLRDLEFSLKSDVWAFGITLWEIFTLSEVPYPGVVWSTEFLLNLENGIRLTKPIYATNDIYEFMLKCWRIKPEDRPSFSEIRDICLQSLNQKFEPVLHQNGISDATPQVSYMELFEGPVLLNI